MPKPVRIALDAMGGDHGPDVVVSGAALALERHSQVAFLFYGEESVVRPLIEASPKLAACSTFVHTNVAVKMGDKPSQALRAGRRTSSMWLAIEAVKRGEADIAVSAGNTGALMAMAKVCLHTMAQIDRPAIAAIWPTIRGTTIVLDVGASIGADAQHLVDLAMMGAAMATVIFDLPRPTVGLLNIGVEEVKGNDGVKSAARMLRELDLPTLAYHGFVEGDDIGKGTVDVVVTDGFTGNVALKTAEGTARQVAAYLRGAMCQSLLAKIGFWIARDTFSKLRAKMDPRHMNGGVFLGLEGIVIKSHGGADSVGFAGAIDIGYNMVRQELLGKIRRSVLTLQDMRARAATAS
jgi:glycerol-3-phosphate acyltransferase PlsX